MRKQKGKMTVGSVLFTVLVILLSILLAGQCVYIYSQLSKEDEQYYPRERDYLRYVTHEEYSRILEIAQEDLSIGREFTETELEIRALGFYYEAASLCRAYEKVHDSESSERQRERMERYRMEAGSYEAETRKIDELLESAMAEE